MNSKSNLPEMTDADGVRFACAMVRDAAFDAILSLWRRRAAEGMTQADLARALGRDAGWVSKNLRGPGNWTLKTLAQFAHALDGEVEVSVYGYDEPFHDNYDAYSGYGLPVVLRLDENRQRSAETRTTTSAVNLSDRLQAISA